MSEFYIDGKLTDWRDVIRLARHYGYESDLFQTSIACRYLREHGHVVTNTPNKEESE